MELLPFPDRVITNENEKLQDTWTYLDLSLQLAIVSDGLTRKGT